MGTSPVVDRSAVGHSLTLLDLNMLSRQYEGKDDTRQCAASETWAIKDDAFLLQDNSPGKSRAGSPGLDSTPKKAISLCSSLLIPPSAPLITPKAKPKSTSSVPVKRKMGYHDQIKQNGELERSNCLDIATIQTEGKTERQQDKEEKMRKTMVDVERSWLADAREHRSHMLAEAARGREHEMMMMDKRLELARLGMAPRALPSTQFGSFTDELNAPLASDRYPNVENTTVMLLSQVLHHQLALQASSLFRLIIHTGMLTNCFLSFLSLTSLPTAQYLVPHPSVLHLQ